MKNIDAFLRDAVFYPCSAFDGTPVRFLGKKGFTNYLYTDFRVKRDDLVDACYNKGFRGYRYTQIDDVDAELLFGNERNHVQVRSRQHSPPSYHRQPLFVTLARFERLSEYSEEHGPESFQLMYTNVEAVRGYRAIFGQRKFPPSCFVDILVGMGFGGNYSQYPQRIEAALYENIGGLPETLLVGYQGFIHLYNPLAIPDGGTNILKEYNGIDSWDYYQEEMMKSRKRRLECQWKLWAELYEYAA